MGERYWEVDAIRGIALIGMIVYHLLACMVIFHMIVEDEEFLTYYGTINIASASFVLIAGVALILRHARKKGRTTQEYYRSIIIKALFLFIVAIGITIVTKIGAELILHNDVYVKFGFLHMLSISILLSLPFLRFGKWNILPGIIIVLIGILLIPQITAPEWLYPLGIHGAEFTDTTQDYFPLFPWFGVLLIGIALGDIFYPNGIRSFRFPNAGIVGKFFSRIGNGKVTLAVYLAHIPVIFVVLWIVSQITGIGYI